MWVKYLINAKEHKAGDLVEIEDAAAKTLIDNGIAEQGQEPAEVVAATTEMKGALAEFVKGAVTEAVDAMKKELVDAIPKKNPRIDVGSDREDSDPTMGFKHIGEQVRYIKGWYAGDTAAQNDPRMKRQYGLSLKAPTTYANEGTGADGGFLLAPNYSNQVLSHTFNDESLFSRTDTYTTGSNSLTVPKDETTPWGTSGVQVYWASEAAQLTQSKLKLGQDNLILQKLTALVPVTDEQLQDSFVGLGQYVTRQASERIRWATDDAIVNGTGAGKPLGIINSGALVQQAAEGSQTAATINLTNIAKMISRIPGASIKNLVWLIHPSAFPQIVVMTNGNNSLYVAPGGLKTADPNLGSLFGIPVIISQHCQAIGTPGDIFLFDLTKYITLTKGDGIQTAMSMHLFFDYNVSTFRFNFRVAGQPWLQAPITSANGSYSMSPFIDLASR